MSLEQRLREAEEKLVAHGLQLGRLVSDAESEKDTRRRLNIDIEYRLRRIERFQYMMAGGILLANVILHYLR